MLNMKLDQKSFKQQSLKCMPLWPWLQHFHTNKLCNLLSLPEGTCLTNMKFVPFKYQSYKVKFLLKQAGKRIYQDVCQVLLPDIQVKLLP